MATINEDYVSFETAKLLEEKGFDTSEIDGYFQFVYYSDGKIDFYDDDKPLFVCKAVTLQMAMKWLREKHNIVVEPFIREDTKYVWYVHRIETRFNKKYLVFCWGSKNNKYERYEQACEAAIKYCLEHLI